MTTIPFDTLKFVKTLEVAGVPLPHAEAFSTTVKNAYETSELITKTDLNTGLKNLREDLRESIQSLELRMIKWFIGISLGQIALLIGGFIKYM